MINRYSTQQFEWLDVTNLTPDEQQLLLEKHQIKQATLTYATDAHERARYSFDLLDNSEMIIFLIYSQRYAKYPSNTCFTRLMGILYFHLLSTQKEPQLWYS